MLEHERGDGRRSPHAAVDAYLVAAAAEADVAPSAAVACEIAVDTVTQLLLEARRQAVYFLDPFFRLTIETLRSQLGAWLASGGGSERDAAKVNRVLDLEVEKLFAEFYVYHVGGPSFSHWASVELLAVARAAGVARRATAQREKLDRRRAKGLASVLPDASTLRRSVVEGLLRRHSLMSAAGWVYGNGRDAIAFELSQAIERLPVNTSLLPLEFVQSIEQVQRMIVGLLPPDEIFDPNSVLDEIRFETVVDIVPGAGVRTEPLDAAAVDDFWWRFDLLDWLEEVLDRADASTEAPHRADNLRDYRVLANGRIWMRAWMTALGLPALSSSATWREQVTVMVDLFRETRLVFESIECVHPMDKVMRMTQEMFAHLEAASAWAFRYDGEVIEIGSRVQKHVMRGLWRGLRRRMRSADVNYVSVETFLLLDTVMLWLTAQNDACGKKNAPLKRLELEVFDVEFEALEFRGGADAEFWQTLDVRSEIFLAMSWAADRQIRSRGRDLALLRARLAAAHEERQLQLQRDSQRASLEAWQATHPAPGAQPYGVSHRGAEFWVRDWLIHMGLHDAQVTAQTNDGGIDVRSSAYVAQVKHYSSQVPIASVRELLGVAHATGAGALFFTSGAYSMGAVELAEKMSIGLFRYEVETATVVPVSTSAAAWVEKGFF